MRAIAVAILIAFVCVCAVYSGDQRASKPDHETQAGEHGFFTYTAIDGSTVTVARQSPESN